MPAETSTSFEALETQASKIMAVFTQAGYERLAPAILQPADLFLDVLGESLRSRTYVFTGQDGEALCLRPDLTHAIARVYLTRHPKADAIARYCTNGPVFRFQHGGGTPAHPREFRQAGIEVYGVADEVKADAEVLQLTVRALESAGLTNYKLRIGDLGLLSALLGAIDIPERWRERLLSLFWRPDAFRAELRRLASVPASAVEGLPADLMAVLDPASPAKAELAVAAHLEATGIELIGTRSLSEITARLLSFAADARAKPLAAETVELIESYLSISAPARAAAARIKDLLGRSKIDLGPALADFERRLALVAKAGGGIGQAVFDSEFGRKFEYYTGFVFEVIAEPLGPESPIAGGGRYDALIHAVGAPSPIPAVGAAIYTDRLLLAVREDAP